MLFTITSKFILRDQKKLILYAFQFCFCRCSSVLTVPEKYQALPFYGCIWIPGGHFMARHSGFISGGFTMGLVPTIFQSCMTIGFKTSSGPLFLVQRLSDYEIKELWLRFDQLSPAKLLVYSVKSFCLPCVPPPTKGNDLTYVLIESHPYTHCLFQRNQFQTLANRQGYICVFERGPLKIHCTVG